MELKDTVKGMLSENYKERFVAEYQQTKIRYKKLKYFCDRMRDQQKYMGMYLGCLEKRAILEGINLD